MSVSQAVAQCATGGAEWLNGANNGIMQDTGLLGGYVTVRAHTVGTMTSGRPLYQVASSSWKGLTYAALQVWRAYSSPGSNYTSFKLDAPLDSTYFHVRVDNIRGDMFNWESQNVRGYRNGVEVPAEFKDPINGATVSNNTISGASSTTSTVQSAMRVFFTGPVDSVVVRQTSWSDWVIIELMMQCNILLPASLTQWRAFRNGSNNEILWQNPSETGISKYELQRSADGRVFTPIATFDPGAQLYKHSDPQGYGLVYYRLRLVYANNSFTYSSTLAVKGPTRNTAMMYPNPVKDVLHVELPAGKSTMNVINMESRSVYTYSGSGRMLVNASNWPAGQYIVIINNGREIMMEKILKLK